MAFNAADKVNLATWNQVSLGSEGVREPDPGLGGCNSCLVVIVTKA